MANTQTVKANLMLATRSYEAALRLAAESRRVLAASLPEGSWQIAAAMNDEGAAHGKLGRYPEAEQLLLASQGGLAQAPIPDLADKGRLRLVDLYTSWGKPAEADRYRSPD